MCKTCYIFAAGDFCGDVNPGTNDLIIAADAGYHHVSKLGLHPDIILGDFDTIGDIPNHNNIIRFPAEKDYTDTELSIIEGIKCGFGKFIICGALGGSRLEHTIANIYLAASYCEKGYDITLTDGNYNICPLHNGTKNFDEKDSGFISVFPISGAANGVSESGLKYHLENATLDSSNPTLCVSNEFIGAPSSISVSSGTIIIIWRNNLN